jgi:hypothetical protein
MALSHWKKHHGKMLCGLFLGSAMAVGGAAQASGPATNHDHGDDEDNHRHSLFTEEAVINTTETIHPMTGEEKLDEPMDFSAIPTQGDARIKRLIDTLRQTRLGRELYDYAASQGTAVQWEAEDDGRVGAFYHGKNLITLDARSPDDAIMLTLAHEIRHAWQFRTLGVHDWQLTPLDRWSASRLIETDSCAFTAHYVADFYKETGRLITAKNNYNRFVIEAYVATPEYDRDYIEGAFIPCFRKVEEYYNALHIRTVSHYFDQKAAIYNGVKDSNSRRIMNNAYNTAFVTPAIEERATMLKGFFTLSVEKNAATIPQIYHMDNTSFLSWIIKQTPIAHPEDYQKITGMNEEFNRMRMHLLTGAQQYNAPRNRAPEPSPEH